MNRDYRKNEKITDYIRSEVRSVLNRPTLRLGDQGEFVNMLQTQLKQLGYYDGNIDGSFGYTTLQSVKAFQTKNKLTVDGIVGKDTWSALINLYSPLPVCETNIHIVQAGESLWSISRKYNTTVEELIRLNNLTATSLSIGQELIVPGTVEETSPSADIIYTVQPGDTLWSIANKYNLTVTELKNYNKLTSNVLSVGQRLTIPISGGITPAPSTIIYTVKLGDSLWSIANKYNTTVDAIKQLNNLASNLLSIGQQLTIPVTDGIAPEPSTIVYTVKSGDSLWSIANKYNTTVDAIKEFNNLTNNLLSIGQVLKIPV